MWVKVCANTNAEDALAAVEFGADAVGFVFAPSPRQVTPKQVRAISDVLPDGVERVGVFGVGSVEEIAHAAEQARLTAVQLHGSFDPEFSRQLSVRLRPQFAIIQTLHWTLGEDDESLARLGAQLRDCDAERVLLDSRAGNALGGTGRIFPWAKARDVLHAHPALRVIVAGGLRPDNVVEAIRTFKPWGVDVASGVESQPGKKDVQKLKTFLENARGA